MSKARQPKRARFTREAEDEGVEAAKPASPEGAGQASPSLPKEPAPQPAGSGKDGLETEEKMLALMRQQFTDDGAATGSSAPSSAQLAAALLHSLSEEPFKDAPRNIIGEFLQLRDATQTLPPDGHVPAIDGDRELLGSLIGDGNELKVMPSDFFALTPSSLLEQNKLALVELIVAYVIAAPSRTALWTMLGGLLQRHPFISLLSPILTCELYVLATKLLALERRRQAPSAEQWTTQEAPSLIAHVANIDMPVSVPALWNISTADPTVSALQHLHEDLLQFLEAADADVDERYLAFLYGFALLKWVNDVDRVKLVNNLSAHSDKSSAAAAQAKSAKVKRGANDDVQMEPLSPKHVEPEDPAELADFTSMRRWTVDRRSEMGRPLHFLRDRAADLQELLPQTDDLIAMVVDALGTSRRAAGQEGRGKGGKLAAEAAATAAELGPDTEVEAMRKRRLNNPFSVEQEQELLRMVLLFGSGYSHMAVFQAQYNRVLAGRRQMDLKDKARNMKQRAIKMGMFEQLMQTSEKWRFIPPLGGTRKRNSKGVGEGADDDDEAGSSAAPPAPAAKTDSATGPAAEE